MNVIRFTYHNTKVDLSVYLLLFFRSAGIYVYERFYEQREIRSGIKFPEEIDKIATFEEYNVDIFVGKNVEESLIDMESKVPACYVVDDCTKTYFQVAVGLLNSLYDIGIIEKEERDDLLNFLQIYDKNDMCKWLLKGRYFFPFKDSMVSQDLAEYYSQCAIQLLNALQSNQTSWGEERDEHMQYAAMNAIYELNWFCNRSDLPLACMPETIIDHCEEMRGQIEKLGDSIKMLEAMVYDDLLNNSNKAYDFYVSCCTPATTYNAYVFLRKGLYWQKFTGQYDQAIKYYLKSVKIFPEYYRAWFKIGLCYQKLNKYREALCAYSNVKKILMRRLVEKQIRPLEIEHLMKSQMYTLAIWQDIYHDYISALDAGRIAEKAIEAIDTTKFWNFMCNNNNDVNTCKEYVKKCIPIRNVYIKIRDLYRLIADSEKEAEYVTKIMEYDMKNELT